MAITHRIVSGFDNVHLMDSGNINLKFEFSTL